MDRVLNLSAFGEVIKNPNKREDEIVTVTSPEVKSDSPEEIAPDADRETMSEESKYGHIFKMVLQNTAQIKLFHWQSHFAGQHKYLDKFFDTLLDLGDTLAETIMGKYGRPVLNKSQLCLDLSNFENPEKGDLKEFMNGLYKCYAIDCKALLDENSDSELINIIDEIVAAVDQYTHLVSLK